MQLFWYMFRNLMFKVDNYTNNSFIFTNINFEFMINFP